MTPEDLLRKLNDNDVDVVPNSTLAESIVSGSIKTACLLNDEGTGPSNQGVIEKLTGTLIPDARVDFMFNGEGLDIEDASFDHAFSIPLGDTPGLS